MTYRVVQVAAESPPAATSLHREAQLLQLVFGFLMSVADNGTFVLYLVAADWQMLSLGCRGRASALGLTLAFPPSTSWGAQVRSRWLLLASLLVRGELC